MIANFSIRTYTLKFLYISSESLVFNIYIIVVVLYIDPIIDITLCIYVMLLFFFFLMIRRPPISTLFPYTTLFRPRASRPPRPPRGSRPSRTRASGRAGAGAAPSGRGDPPPSGRTRPASRGGSRALRRSADTPRGGAPTRRARAGSARHRARGRSAASTRRASGQLLPYPAAHRPPLHPAHREGVGERPEHPVPHPVLRPAEAARPVAHRHLADPPPLHLDQRRQEAMHPIEQRQLARGVRAECLQGAPGIADRLPVQPVAHAVGDPALEALPARVPAVHPIAHDRRSTAPLELVQQRRNVGRIVLQVGVERHGPAAARGSEPGGERRGLAGVRREGDDVQLRVVSLQRLEHVERTVGRPVVHGHDLVAPSGERPRDLLDEHGEAVALVVHGDDEREVNGGPGAGHT